MTDQASLVLNIEAATPSMVRAMDRHELERSSDGTSAIDPLRRHLNQVLHGLAEGPSASLDAFYAKGVKRPTKQAESPYLRIVLGASASFFRPHDPAAVGTWDQVRLDAWVEVSMASLRAEFGVDLVHVSLHLDEDTPHLHVLVAPTYGRKPRKPGKRRKSETEDAFVARIAVAQDADGVRTVGRSSHATLSKKGSYENLRRRFAVDVAPLGIDYGEVRTPTAPPGLSTREWVRQEAARLARERHDVEAREVSVANRERDLSNRGAALDARETAVGEWERDLAQDALTLNRARQEARSEGLAHGRADAQAEVRELRREVRDLRRGLLDWLDGLRGLAERSVIRAGIAWIERLDGLRDRLRGGPEPDRSGSGSREVLEAPEEPVEEPRLGF